MSDHDPDLELRTVHYLYVPCSFRVRNFDLPGLAASDTCGDHATSAVVDGHDRLYRCPRHQGMIDQTRTGHSVAAVYVRRST